MILQNRFLIIDTCSASVHLMGYRLSLSPTEFALLKLIALQDTHSDSKYPEFSPSTIPVHVWSINKKAKKISGRRLIESINGNYRINPLM